jgi:hypothetical protein
MPRQWITLTDMNRSELGDPVASVSKKGAKKITVVLGDATDGTPHVWKNRKQARKWVEALTVVPVWREGAYYEYLYEGITLRSPITPAVVTDDELAFEGDLVEPSDPYLAEQVTFETPTEASLSDLKSDTHIPVGDALGLTRDPPHHRSLADLAEPFTPTPPTFSVDQEIEAEKLSCDESVYVGPEFYLCSKPEGHGGAHQDTEQDFRWGEPQFFAADGPGSVVNTEEVKFEIPEKLNFALLNKESLAFERLAMDLFLQPVGLPARCQSICSVDGYQCVFPETHATEINEYPAWHESDTNRSWRVGVEDVYFEDAKEDPLNVFLDALEELGIPETLQLRVQEGDALYTWRGFYWSVTHEVDLLTVPLT